MSECSIEVKALEWRERVGVAGTFDAESPIGNFIASVTDEGRGLWFIVGLTGSNYVGSTVSEAKAAAQSDFDARIRSAIEPAKVTVQEEFESVRRYLAVERKAEPVASRPMLGDMPSYGRASFSDLVKAVALAIYDREDVPIDLDLGEFIGHQMVPRINFNSLNRIVSAFSTPPAAPVRDEVVSQAVCRLLHQLGAIPTKNISQHDRDVRTLIDALSASPSPVGESRDALIERLVKALSAFAEAADIFEREYGDKMKPDTGCNIKFSALCEARAVLASKEQQS